MNELADNTKYILQAILAGKQIQYLGIHNIWYDMDYNQAVLNIFHEELRVKPEVRSINGTEFGAPDGSGVYTLGGIFPQSWTRKEERDTAYQAIVDALEGKLK